MIFICHNAFNRDIDKTAWLLLQVIRSYTFIDLLLSFDVHTEDTIAEGREEINVFIDVLQV